MAQQEMKNEAPSHVLASLEDMATDLDDLSASVLAMTLSLALTDDVSYRKPRVNRGTEQ